MSRVLKNGENQITQSYQSHYTKVASGLGWAIGVDVVKKTLQCDYIIAHTTGTVIKVVDYLAGTNGVCDNEGMGYGNYVAILHDNNIVTLYAHLANVQSGITEGKVINKGTIIGFMGNTGNSAGAHLHFEVRKYNCKPTKANLHDKSKFEFLNPEPYLDNDLPGNGSGEKIVKDRYIVYDSNKIRNSSYNNLNYAKAQADKICGTVYDTVINQTVYKAAKALTRTSYPNYYDDSVYRVRKTFTDSATAKGSFSTWAYAYDCWNKYKIDGYHVYNNDGKQLD